MNTNNKILEQDSGIQSAQPKYRWLILMMAFSAWITTFFVRLAWSNAGSSVVDSLGLTTASIGTFITTFYIGYMVSNFFMGFVTDRIGARLSLLLALVPLGLACAGFGMIKSQAAGLAMQLAMGFFAGVDNAACTKLVATWFRKKNLGLALGLFATAPSLGIGITNAVYPYALTLIDWRTLYIALGGWTVAVALFTFAMIRNQPADAGAQLEKPSANMWAMLKNREIRILGVAGFGAIWATWGFAFWANTLMIKAHGMSAADAGLVSVAFAVGAVVTKPLIGWLSDTIGGRHKLLITICIGSLAVLMMLFGQAQTKTQFLIIAPFLGCAAFNYSPLMNALTTRIVGIENTASAIGMMNGIWQVGSVIAPSAVAYAFAQTNSFTVAFTVLAAGPTLGFFLILMLRTPAVASAAVPHASCNTVSLEPK